MFPPMTMLNWLAVLPLLMQLGALGLLLYAGMRIRPLPAIPVTPGTWLPVSIVIPARNEAAAIEPALRSVLAKCRAGCGGCGKWGSEMPLEIEMWSPGR